MSVATAKQILISDIDENFIKSLRLKFPPEEDNPDWNLDKTIKLVTNEKNILIIGYYEDNIAGFLYGHELDRFDDEKQFFIYEVGVADKYLRKGVAREIFKVLKEILISKNFDEAWVLTNKSNIPAMALYQATGGKIESEDEQMFVYKLK